MERKGKYEPKRATTRKRQIKGREKGKGKQERQ